MYKLVFLLPFFLLFLVFGTIELLRQQIEKEEKKHDKTVWSVIFMWLRTNWRCFEHEQKKPTTKYIERIHIKKQLNQGIHSDGEKTDSFI